MAEKPKGQDVRADIRKPEVEDLLCVLAQLDDADTIFALLEGLSYAAIEAQTGASATTIARVSKCLTYGSGGYEAALDILESQES